MHHRPASQAVQNGQIRIAGILTGAEPTSTAGRCAFSTLCLRPWSPPPPPASVLASFLPAHPVAGMRGAGRGPPQPAAAMVLVAGEWLAGGPGWYVALWW